MSEYIKREDATRKVTRMKKDVGINGDYMLIDVVSVSDINAIPAADVEPVVRGEWKWYDRKEAEIYAPLGMVVCAESYVCSNCGNYIGRSSPRDYRPKYCDNCGAHMERSGSGE